MPLPLILLSLAAIGGTGGLGMGIHGAVKMNSANNCMEDTNALHEANIERFRIQNVETCRVMDTLGRFELDILRSFKDFSNVFEKLRNKPKFDCNYECGVSLPQFDPEEIKKVSIGAAALLNLISGGVAGVAGGFAAAGAASAAVTALGTASTGVAIANLSGQAAINATLAALGGGSLSVGGGGIALGTTVLGAATLGVGLLIGGVIFSFSGSSLSKKAEEAWEQVQIEKTSVDKICSYLKELSESGNKFNNAITKIRNIYKKQLYKLCYTVNVLGKTDYKQFTNAETLNLQNTILLVGLLNEMCKVKLVLKNEKKDDINTVNNKDIEDSIANSEKTMQKISIAPEKHSLDVCNGYDTLIDELTSEADAILNAYK